MNKNQHSGLIHRPTEKLCLAEARYQFPFKGLAADFNPPEAIQSTFDQVGT